MKHAFRIASLVLAVASLAGLTAGAGASAATASQVDEAFARQMPIHHSMAIEMAQMAIEQAEHKAIRTTARNIVKTQRHEIDRLMKIGDRLGIEPPASHGHMQMMDDLDTLGLTMEQAGMDMEMGMLDGADRFDREFIDMMVPHHQGAIRMARVELKRGKDSQLREIARAIVKAQAKEISQMNKWRTAWYGVPSPAGGVPKS